MEDEQLEEKPQFVRIKEFSLNNPKNIVYFNKEQFDQFLVTGTIFIDKNGTAIGENEIHIYVCENYEK